MSDSSDTTLPCVEKSFTGFFKDLFSCDEQYKCTMLNSIQYMLLAIIPVIIILKLQKHFVPDDDDTKPTLEILLEIILQLLFIIVTITITNKAIRYIPTFSKIDYCDSDNYTIYIVPFLLLLSTMQTKFGTKINILYTRLENYIYGKTATPPPVATNKNQHKPHMKNISNLLPTRQNTGATQFPSQQTLIDTPFPSTQALNNNTGNLPAQGMPGANQANPNFNAMYQHNNTPLVDANVPGGQMYDDSLFEPAAANEYSTFSKW